jgi:hypothetical protein
MATSSSASKGLLTYADAPALNPATLLKVSL